MKSRPQGDAPRRAATVRVPRRVTRVWLAVVRRHSLEFDWAGLVPEPSSPRRNPRCIGAKFRVRHRETRRLLFAKPASRGFGPAWFPAKSASSSRSRGRPRTRSGVRAIRG